MVNLEDTPLLGRLFWLPNTIVVESKKPANFKSGNQSERKTIRWVPYDLNQKGVGKK